MTVLFSSLAPVKSNNNFGRGVLRTRLADDQPTAADRAEYAAWCAERERAREDAERVAFHAHLEDQAEHARWNSQFQ